MLTRLSRYSAPSIQPSAKRLSSTHHIQSLQDAFKDPDSPFYLAPGEVGPSDAVMWPGGEPPEPGQEPGTGTISPEMTEHGILAAQAEKHALNKGHDPLSFWEQRIVWGDLDSFRHLNNVRYVRFIESSRMKYFGELARRLRPELARNMLEGRGKSIILKSINVNFKRPVVYPDTLLVSQRAHALEPTRFHLSSSLYSYTQQTDVATSDAICVWYDYDTLKKCEAPEEIDTLLKERVKLGEAAQKVSH